MRSVACPGVVQHQDRVALDHLKGAMAPAARDYAIARSAINSPISTAQESAESPAITKIDCPGGRRPSEPVDRLGLARCSSAG